MVTPAQPSLRRRAHDAALALLERFGSVPRVAMLLGTGHGGIANQLTSKVIVTAEALPAGLRFAQNAPLLFGQLEGVPVVVGEAPVPAWETQGQQNELGFPVRVMRAMGADLLILTAGAASVLPQIEPGSLAVVEDHINLSGINPLLGLTEEDLGPRFPDMTEAYQPRWREFAREVAGKAGLPCSPAVLAAMPGPCLPTRAEYRLLRALGADLVSMSLVPDVLTAVHAGFEVLALCGIMQTVPLDKNAPVSIEQMLDAADLAAPRMAAVLAGVVRGFGRG
jgi:purine-nucleoside phosphorylase